MYGGPYVVDFTPPEIEEGGGVWEVEGGGVWDGEGGELDYHNSTTLEADWSSIVDRESGVVECGWSIGEVVGGVRVGGVRVGV